MMKLNWYQSDKSHPIDESMPPKALVHTVIHYYSAQKPFVRVKLVNLAEWVEDAEATLTQVKRSAQLKVAEPTKTPIQMAKVHNGTFPYIGGGNDLFEAIHPIGGDLAENGFEAITPIGGDLVENGFEAIHPIAVMDGPFEAIHPIDGDD